MLLQAFCLLLRPLDGLLYALFILYPARFFVLSYPLLGVDVLPALVADVFHLAGAVIVAAENVVWDIVGIMVLSDKRGAPVTAL